MKYPGLPVIALLTALGGCASMPSRLSQAAPITVGGFGTRDMAEGEDARLAVSHGRARRQGDDLILTFANGKSRTFHSNTKGCEDGPADCEGYILIGDLPAFHWLVLFESHYEGGNFTLMDDRDGLPTPIPYWPTFSPDGSRILIQNDDETSDFPGDTLEIWRREGFRAEPEWIANPDESDTSVAGAYHTRLLRWQGDRITLEFSTNEVFDAKTRLTIPGRQWIGTITRGPNGWTLDARAPKANK